MRTITQRTTLPFLICESGAASLTLAVTTSPRPARSPRSPPRGRIHASLRAPELSATSRIVRIPIIKGSSKTCPVHSLNVQIRRLRAHLGRAPDHFHQRPTLELAQGPALDNSHHVTVLGRALLVVRVKLLSFADDALVQRVRHAAADFHHDGLLHLRRDDFADLFVFYRFGLCFGHHFFPSTRSRRIV